MERMGLTPDWIIQVCRAMMRPACSQQVQSNMTAHSLLTKDLTFNTCSRIWKQEAWVGLKRREHLSH